MSERKHTEQSIQRILYGAFGDTYDYCTENMYVFRWESDFFCVSKAGLAVDFEIKISKSDFRAEFTKKTAKHEVLRDGTFTQRFGTRTKNGEWAYRTETQRNFQRSVWHHRFTATCGGKDNFVSFSDDR